MLLALSAAALIVVAWPGLPTRIVAPSLDLALDSVALVVTSIVATLSWIRYRNRQERFALYQTGAFLVLAITYLRAVVDTVGADPTAPLASTEPGQEQLVVFLAGRTIAAALLVVGGLAALHGGRPALAPFVVALAVALALAVAALAHPAAAALPALLEPTPVASHATMLTPLGTLLHLAGAAVFVGSVIVSRRLWRRDGSIGDAYVCIGLLFGAFAMVIGATTPGSHPGPVSVADALWLCLHLSLLLAIEAEAAVLLASLRRANAALEQLRAAEVAQAGLEERTRLSRELHDGLTQDLWLAKLKVGRLAGAPGLDDTAKALVDEASGAIDQGLAEAHQAVMALRIAGAVDGAFGQLLARYTEDFEDRFGLRVHVACDPDLPRLPVRTQAELLRIAQEALANVHRHASARRIDVEVRVAGTEVELSVTDDGRGFVVDEPRPTDFGLLAMRERAALVGGTLSIRSAPGAGTRVEVRAPLAGPSADRTGQDLEPGWASR